MPSVFVYKDTPISSTFQKIYMDALKINNVKKCLTGVDPKFRINEKSSYFTDISDTDTIFMYCIYPLYYNGYTDIKSDFEKILLEMAYSDDIIEVFQVYNFILSQDHICGKNYEAPLYDDIPFTIDFSEIIKVLFMRNEFYKNAIDLVKAECGGNFLICEMWRITQNIINRSPTIQQYLKLAN